MGIKNQIRFIAKEKTDFFEILKNRVDSYFTDNKISKNANTTMIIKSIVLLSGYFIPFILILLLQPSFYILLSFWMLMGISIAGIGMSIMHDANHGSYSKNSTVNYLLGHTLNLIGGSVSNWKYQHNVLHHTYTNVAGIDDDIQDRLVLKFSPHSNAKYFHRFQKYYAFFLYGITTLYWVFAKDFIQLSQFTKRGVNTSTPKEIREMLVRIIFDKALYLFVLIGVPVLFFNSALWEILIGFFIMHFLAGLILTVVFQLAHTVEGSAHPLPNNTGTIENNWAIHQLSTTVNFSPQNKFLSWYVGGLNYQIEHHLFSKICHVHYPAIAHIIEKTAKEYNIPYMVNKTFVKALRSHIITLERFGTMPSLNDAIG